MNIEAAFDPKKTLDSSEVMAERPVLKPSASIAVSRTLPDDLFATSASLAPRMQFLGGQIPYIVIDDVYRDPARVRQAALGLEFEPPSLHYPGRIAAIDDGNPTVAMLLRKLLQLVNREYLPRVPPIVHQEGTTVTAFSRLTTDFGIIDVPPDELLEGQRIPHIDPVAIFGLLYLNEEPRGGTMFFQPAPAASQPSEDRRGYFREGDSGVRLIGKIEGRYNSLAIYPGFVPHSGEIGKWIEAEERRTCPRLTQRFLFYP